MKPYHQTESVTIYHGDCREVLQEIVADCVVTDPPYGETSLAWDKWQNGWLPMVQSSSMWCFGSLRMFMENATDFDGWKLVVLCWIRSRAVVQR